MTRPIRVNAPAAALAIVAAACALIAPAILVALLAARPPLATSANAYRTDAMCDGPASHGLPPPAAPIPQSLRAGYPCAITGAMIVEKDTVSQGAARATHYALGLRTDEGATFDATLASTEAEDLWNRVQAGDRVIVQTYSGQPALVGDGTRTVQTEQNPVWQAANNGLAVAASGGVFAVEVVAAAILALWWRRSRTLSVS